MNALELADLLKKKLNDTESYYGDAENLLIKSETMLRTLHAEKERLKEASLTLAKEYGEDIGKCAIALDKTNKEKEALKKEKLEYAEEVLEALEWGSYAGDYFQNKHGWHEDIEKWTVIVNELRKAQE